MKTEPRKSSDTPNSLQLARVYVIASFRTARLIVVCFGIAAVVLSAVMTGALTVIAHLNAPVAFAGSMVGMFLISLCLPVVKSIWKSELATVCQQERYWSLADKIVFDELEGHLPDVLAGRHPQVADRAKFELALSQAQLIFIRRGEPRKSMQVAEYLLNRLPDSDPGYETYQSHAVAIMYVDCGRYQQAIAMLRNSLARLEAKKKTCTPVYVSGLLGLIQAYIELHNVVEAEKNLRKFKDILDDANRTANDEIGDTVVRWEASKIEIDTAFYLKLCGQLKTLTGEADAELALVKARDIMKENRLQKICTLFYPEVLGNLAVLANKEKNYRQAEEKALASLDFYETKTRYRGPDYFVMKALLAYARLKQGKGNDTQEFQLALEMLRSEFEKVHPRTATVLMQLAESEIMNERWREAEAALQDALRIRTALFSQDDADVRQVEEMLAITAEKLGKH